MRLTRKQIEQLRESYNHLGNFESDDPLAPIDPDTWQSPESDRLIHIAALRGDYTAVELLVTAGEDVNAIGDMGLTPAHYAAMGQYRGIFDFLLQHGADMTIVDEFGDTAPQKWATSKRKS